MSIKTKAVLRSKTVRLMVLILLVMTVYSCAAENSNRTKPKEHKIGNICLSLAKLKGRAEGFTSSDTYFRFKVYPRKELDFEIFPIVKNAMSVTGMRRFDLVNKDRILMRGTIIGDSTVITDQISFNNIYPNTYSTTWIYSQGNPKEIYYLKNFDTLYACSATNFCYIEFIYNNHSMLITTHAAWPLGIMPSPSSPEYKTWVERNNTNITILVNYTVDLIKKSSC